jgi:hypothetical protein
MEDLPIGLIYEFLRYDPYILPVVGCVSRKLAMRLQLQLDYLQTLLEDLYNDDCRDKTFSDCMDLMRKQSKFYWADKLVYCVEDSKRIRYLNVKSMTIGEELLPANLLFSFAGVWLWLPNTNLFFTGGKSGEFLRDVFEVDLRDKVRHDRRGMNYAR